MVRYGWNDTCSCTLAGHYPTGTTSQYKCTKKSFIQLLPKYHILALFTRLRMTVEIQSACNSRAHRSFLKFLRLNVREPSHRSLVPESPTVYAGVPFYRFAVSFVATLATACLQRYQFANTTSAVKCRLIGQLKTAV